MSSNRVHQQPRSGRRATGNFKQVTVQPLFRGHQGTITYFNALGEDKHLSCDSAGNVSVSNRNSDEIRN